MALVALDGTPLVAIGANAPFASSALPSSNSTTQDAANEATIFYGQIFTEDGGSHTIDTTGSSSLGWRPGAVTFANVGTTFKVGLAALDLATGPPARAANVADVITLDVSRSYTSAAPMTANTWTESVPTAGTKTVANGDFIAFCTQMTARGGADSVVTAWGSVLGQSPGVTGFVGAAYANQGGLPNAVITFSDGTLGFFYGGTVFTTASTTQTWNSGSATKEYGNYLRMPFPVKVYGIYAACSFAGDTDLVLYSDPFGTPAAQKTVSVDLNTITAVTQRWAPYLFSSPYTTTSDQPLAAIFKPTSVTNTDANYKTFNAAAHQKSENLGTNCYAVSRASGAFAAVNSNKDRFTIGLLVGSFEHGVAPTYGMGI